MPAVVRFDGACTLCNGSIRFIAARDRRGEFTFAPLESADASSIELIQDGRTYTKSTAALRIARRLRFPWPLAYALILVPRRLRDAVYDAVASRRHQLTVCRPVRYDKGLR